MSNNTEVWLRGPLTDIPALVQPVAHALLQAREEINELMHDFPTQMLWEKPAGLASPGFHLQHLTGVLDRLFTYAADRLLNEQQLSYLSMEGIEDKELKVDQLVLSFNQQVDNAIKQLSQTDPTTLTEVRCVGRAKLPSTVIGLYVHAAEHTMRHLGQLLVTAKLLKAGTSGNNT